MRVFGVCLQAKANTKYDRFLLQGKPALSVTAYLERICLWSECSPSCLIFAMIYIDRLQSSADVFLTSKNVHKFILTSVMIAAKFVDDRYHNNKSYARIGGVALKDINAMEVDLAFSLRFNLNASPKEFTSYAMGLQKHFNEVCLPQNKSMVAKTKKVAAPSKVVPVVAKPAVPMQVDRDGALDEDNQRRTPHCMRRSQSVISVRA